MTLLKCNVSIFYFSLNLSNHMFLFNDIIVKICLLGITKCNKINHLYQHIQIKTQYLNIECIQNSLN